MKKKNIFIYVLLIILLFYCILLTIQVINISKKYNNLQIAMSENLGNVQSEEYSDNYNAKIEMLENEIHALQTENSTSQHDDEINSIKKEIKQLKTQYNSLPDYSKNITNLENKINILEDNYSSTQQTNNIIGKWKTTVETRDFFTDAPITCVTIYEFKSNGDFYINENKVGTYSNNYIFFKDANDEQYRVGNYYYFDNNLYLNSFANTQDILVSSNFYKCEKI